MQCFAKQRPKYEAAQAEIETAVAAHGGQYFQQGCQLRGEHVPKREHAGEVVARLDGWRVAAKLRCQGLALAQESEVVVDAGVDGGR